jgi:fatty acid desaturase
VNILLLALLFIIGGIAFFVMLFGIWCAFLELFDRIDEHRRNKWRVPSRPKSRFDLGDRP